MTIPSGRATSSSIQVISIILHIINQKQEQDASSKSKEKGKTGKRKRFYHETIEDMFPLFPCSQMLRAISTASSSTIRVAGLVKCITQAFVLNHFTDTVTDCSRPANLLTQLVAAFFSSFLTETPGDAWKTLA